MGRFYFDITDDAGAVIDEVGADFLHIESARKEAMLSLGEIAKDLMGSGDPGRVLSITVRDERSALFTVRMRFEVIIAQS